MKNVKYVIALSVFVLSLMLFMFPGETKREGSVSEKIKKMTPEADEKEGKEKPDSPDKFAEYINDLKTGYDGKTYPGNYRMEELNKAFARLSLLKTKTADLNWKERGPGNVGGRTRALVIDPKDTSGDTWLAGSVSGGVWRTEDAGKNWVCITPDIPNLAIGCIAISEADPNVIYVGTGEGYYNIDAITGDGIFKSTDNGATWVQLASTVNNINFNFVNRLITDPSNSSVVIAATNYGVFRSTDGGGTWTNKEIPGRAQQILFEKNNFLNQYVAVNGKGIYKSCDGGESWFKVMDLKEGRIEMAISPGNPDVVFALSGESNLYMSVDGGYNWAQDQEDPKTDFLSGQGWYNNTLTVDPSDSNVLFIGGVDVYKVTVETSKVGDAVQAFGVVSESSDWIDYDNFGGRYLKGGFDVNMSNSTFEDCNINFLGDSVQKAHRFTYDGNKYTYKDFVEVPFSVTKISDGQKLNISFVDDNNNGVFDLTETGKEYIYIHSTDYTGNVSDEIAVDNGVGVNNLYKLLAVMQPGKTWDTEALDPVKVSVSGYLLQGRKMTSKRKTYWYKEFDDPQYSHADHHGLCIDTSNGSPYRILDCNDGGIAYSDDGGENWKSPVMGYVTSQFYSVAKHPTENMYFGGQQDNGTWFSNVSPGADSYWNQALGGDGFGVAWHSRKPEQMIASLYYNQLYRTDDKWKYMYAITEDIDDVGSDSDAPFITVVATSFMEPDLLFIAGPSGIWRSVNFGLNWDKITIPDEDYGYEGNAVQIRVSDADANVVWAGLRMDDDGKLNVSTNMGKSFVAVNNPSAKIRRISRIVTDPYEPDIVYVLSSASGRPKIIRSLDRGNSWKDITGFTGSSSSTNGFPDVATYSLLVMPYNTNVLWAGTEIGLFISEDNGETWHYSDNGLPAVCIWDMAIVGDQAVLGTHGRGVWSVTLPEMANVPDKPYIAGAAITPDKRLLVRYDITSVFDSLEFYVAGDKTLTIKEMNSGISDEKLEVNSPLYLFDCRVFGYKEGKIYRSNIVQVTNYDYSYTRVKYYNDFENKKNDFYGKGFTVSNVVGNNYAINSYHPYKERDNFTYILKYPIVVESDPKVSVMTYEDIAFVEKGEPGAVYGDDDFWDYVIVEGSKDGIDWLPLIDGYDFGFTDKWDDGNTDINTQPEPDRYISHTINLQDAFAPGDTILIRFRLFSDPYTVGWGWVIDNVNIQKDGSGIFNKRSVQEGALTVSPNPAVDHVNIQLDSEKTGALSVKVYDLSGKVLFDENYDKYTGIWREQIPVKGFGKGVRIVEVVMDGSRYTERIVIK